MRKGDFVVIAFTVIALLIWLFPSRSGEIVEIKVNGELYETLPLGEDALIEVKSEFGVNVVEIINSRVSIKESDCKNKLCNKETISKNGQSIVCLPNKLSVTIVDKSSNETDVLI